MRPESAAFLRHLLRDEHLPVEESAVEVATTLGKATAILAAVDQAFGPDARRADIITAVRLGDAAAFLAELHALATDDAQKHEEV